MYLPKEADHGIRLQRPIAEMCQIFAEDVALGHLRQFGASCKAANVVIFPIDVLHSPSRAGQLIPLPAVPGSPWFQYRPQPRNVLQQRLAELDDEAAAHTTTEHEESDHLSHYQAMSAERTTIHTAPSGGNRRRLPQTELICEALTLAYESDYDPMSDQEPPSSHEPFITIMSSDADTQTAEEFEPGTAQPIVLASIGPNTDRILDALDLGDPAIRRLRHLVSTTRLSKWAAVLQGPGWALPPATAKDLIDALKLDLGVSSEATTVTSQLI